MVHLLIATSLPENLFLSDDITQPEMFPSVDANLNYDLPDSSNLILGSNFNTDNTDIFSIPPENDLTLDNTLASTQPQTSCQTNNDLTLTNGLQARDSEISADPSTSSCGPNQNSAAPQQLNLPLDLFDDPINYLLRGNLPPADKPSGSGSQRPPERQSPEEELFGQLFDNLHPKDVLEYLKKCIEPFIFPLCCDAADGFDGGGLLIIEIPNCYVGEMVCRRRIEACCMKFVSWEWLFFHFFCFFFFFEKSNLTGRMRIGGGFAFLPILWQI